MAFSRCASLTSFLFVWDSNLGLGIVTPTIKVIPVRISLSVRVNLPFLACLSSLSLIALTKSLLILSWWKPPSNVGVELTKEINLSLSSFCLSIVKDRDKSI